MLGILPCNVPKIAAGQLGCKPSWIRENCVDRGGLVCSNQCVMWMSTGKSPALFTLSSWLTGKRGVSSQRAFSLPLSRSVLKPLKPVTFKA